ncbi:hypothetical protein QR680_008156 [Steinernema hermaphroditum]|uniref:C-type lectin domain-containing protein n=1 Tax=Steinernema hermaphroditum TaxID=289476 RepID=A0AA39M6J9_9BILA|nr:hypothetical protein QR680_008156 [Steinernema hermaphroditum]
MSDILVALAFWLLIFPISTIEGRVRYSLIPHGLTAALSLRKGIVVSRYECMVHAYTEKNIAFTIENNPTGMECFLLDTLTGFQNGLRNVATYLLDQSSQNNDQCLDPSKIDVRQFLNGPKKCELNEALCNKMKNLYTHCTTKADNPKCMIECPKGERTLEGSNTCCYVVKDINGKEKCCPVESRGKYSNGTSFCCPTGQVALGGSSSCCWAIKENGKDVCCPKNTFPGKYGGKEVCCPEKDKCCARGYEVAGADGNKAVCCPKGKMFVKKVDRKEICCSRGTEYKGMHEDNPVCCPSDMEWTSGSSVCCPPGFTYRKEFGKCLKHVAIDKSRQLHGIKEMNDYCKKLKADPVKIENAAQNQVVASMDSEAVIGLQIPEGEAWSKDGFRWVSDGSKPSYTNFIPGEPNNLIGISAPAQGPEYFVRLNGHGQWLDVNGTPAWLGLRGILKFETLLVKFIADANLSANVTEYQSFKALVRFNASDVKIPSRHELLGPILDREYQRAKDRTQSVFSGKPISITADSYTKGTHSLFAITAC